MEIWENERKGNDYIYIYIYDLTLYSLKLNTYKPIS